MGLVPIYQALALTYYRWAMRQIDPLHPDLPGIVLRIHDLEHSHDSVPLRHVQRF